MRERDKNRGSGHVTADRGKTVTDVRSLARSFTRGAVRVLNMIMNDETQPGMTRVTAAVKILERGWGRPSETHRIDINGETTLLKVVNEIVHVHETREEIEFRDQVPLLELAAEDSDGESKKTH